MSQQDVARLLTQVGVTPARANKLSGIPEQSDLEDGTEDGAPAERMHVEATAIGGFCGHPRSLRSLLAQGLLLGAVLGLLMGVASFGLTLALLRLVPQTLHSAALVSNGSNASAFPASVEMRHGTDSHILSLRQNFAMGLACALIVWVAIAIGTPLPEGFRRLGLNVAHASPVLQVAMDLMGTAILCQVFVLVLSPGD